MRSSPATIAGSATPAACAAAAAPSAFDTLWRPASGSRTRADWSSIASVNTVTKAPASMRPAMASARTSALASMPKRRMRAPCGAIVRHDSANGSSALMTAVPPAVQGREHLALGAGDAGEVAESLEVLVAGVRDQRDRGPRERGERGDLARVIRAHLDHRMAVRGLEPQQRQRHADVVVEVAAGGERRSRAGEDRRQHLLGGRLAVAAADAEHECVAACAPGGGERGERRLGVRDGDLGQGAVGGSRDHGARGPARGRGRDECVAVEALAARAPRTACPRSIVRESVETPANAASAPARRPPAIAATSASRPFMPHPARARAGARGR